MFQVQARFSLHYLKRFFYAFPNQRHTQTRMTLASLLPGCGKRCFRQLASQNKIPDFGQLLRVRSVARLEQQSFLPAVQWINILEDYLVHVLTFAESRGLAQKVPNPAHGSG